jgi:hypothetical protein
MFARLLPLSLVLSGCATTWIATQASGTQAAWDESVREVRVPQPGIEERLAVSVPLVPQYAPASSPTTTHEPLPFALTCQTVQTAQDVVYHQAFRYGSRWKKMTAVAFVLESALGAVFLLSADRDHPNGYLYGGFLAADAVVTAPLFFIPRKEIYRSNNVTATTPVREDCPDGLALEIGEHTFPVDAAGRIGELGETAFADWQRAPGPPLRVVMAGQARDVYAGMQVAVVHFVVPAGTFASITP